MTILPDIAASLTIGAVILLAFDQATLKQRIRRIVREDGYVSRAEWLAFKDLQNIAAIGRHAMLQRQIEEKIAASQRPTPEPERSAAA